MTPLPAGPFTVVLADPPWAFKSYSGKTGTPHRSANDHYVTTETGLLADIPVIDIVAKDAALFMWVVDSHIEEAFALAKAWGFSFKTKAFTWVKLTSTGKPKIGMGYWTRKQVEICLMFTRGKPKRVSKGVRELIDDEFDADGVIRAVRREHSRKPDEQYERIEALMGDVPRLELFARRGRAGWSAWGNEAPGLSNALSRATEAVTRLTEVCGGAAA